MAETPKDKETIETSSSVPASVSQSNSFSTSDNVDPWGKVSVWEGKISHLTHQIEQLEAFAKETQELAQSSANKESNLREKIDHLEDTVSKHTRENIELLGIFFTLFTFISVSVSIVLQLKTVFHAAFILMLLLTGLMVFLYFFHHLLHHEHKPLEEIPYEQGKFRIITFIKHQWKTGNLCYTAPALLAILCGIVAYLVGSEISDTKETTNVNYIQNMPTSKIRLDENIEQYTIPNSVELPKTTIPTVSK